MQRLGAVRYKFRPNFTQDLLIKQRKCKCLVKNSRSWKYKRKAGKCLKTPCMLCSSVMSLQSLCLLHPSLSFTLVLVYLPSPCTVSCFHILLSNIQFSVYAFIEFNFCSCFFYHHLFHSVCLNWMPVWMFVWLSFWLSDWLSVQMKILSISDSLSGWMIGAFWRSEWLSEVLSVCLNGCLSVRLSVVIVCLSFRQSRHTIRLSACLPACLPACLSVCIR